MGSFNMSDLVTGLTIERNERAVALVIVRRTGGYPDAAKAAAYRPMGATYLFEPASIPIRGTYGDYGRFVPDEGSLGVRLVCAMTGVRSWEEFEEKGLSFQGEGLAIARTPSYVRMGGEPNAPQVFGIAMFKEETWAHLADVAGLAERRDADLRTMNAIVEDAHAVMHGPLKGVTDRQVYMALHALEFELGTRYTLRDGSVVEVPFGMRGLAHGEGGDNLSEYAKQWITGASEVGDAAMQEGTYPAAMGEWIEGIWELQAGIQGLGYLNRTLGASSSSGQQSNADDVAGLGLGMVEQAATSMIRQIEEYDREDLSEVEAIVERLDRLRASVAGRLEAIVEERESFSP